METIKNNCEKIAKIREMSAADVPQVAALERACFSDPWPESILTGELENELSLWLVAVDSDEKVLGYVGSQTVLGEADMMNLAVASAARRCGIGAALVAALCGELVRQKCAISLTLEVRASNEPAIRLYMALGFTQIGRRPNYYVHPKEDACIYRKDLTV